MAAHGEHEAGAGAAMNELNVQDFAPLTLHGRQVRRWWSDQDGRFGELLTAQASTANLIRRNHVAGLQQ